MGTTLRNSLVTFAVFVGLTLTPNLAIAQHGGGGGGFHGGGGSYHGGGGEAREGGGRSYGGGSYGRGGASEADRNAGSVAKQKQKETFQITDDIIAS